MRKYSGWVSMSVLLASTLAVSSCTFLDSFVPKKGETTDVVDRDKNLTIEDYQKLSEIDKEKIKGKDGEVKVTAELGAPPIPDVAQVLAMPSAPKVANTKLVTLAVTDDVPLRDVLFELGRLAKVDIEVGPGLDKTGINLRATDRPFNEVIERIATLGNLRYSVNGGAIRVEKDAPYIKNYPLDFLNVVRSSNSNYSLNTSVLASGSSGGSSSSGSSGSSSGSGSSGGTVGQVGTNNTSSTIASQSESDLWVNLQASVEEILKFNPSEGGEDAADKTASSGKAGDAQGAVTINRQAGVLSVRATDRQHEMVDRFLKLMTRNTAAQVLIEAKIVEVELNDEFSSGVNWNKVLGNATGTGPRSYLSLGSYSQPGFSQTFGGQSSSGIAFGVRSGDLDFVIKAAEQYGTTRTLSSPRLSAINNQQAVLTFATNEVFFDCTYTAASTTTSGTGTTGSGGSSTTATNAPTYNCSAKSVPIGIILNILPSINLDHQEVTLSVRPTLTRKLSDAVNPQGAFTRAAAVATATTSAAIDLAKAIPDTAVPVIQVREVDSITKVKSGGVMVIGGLMEDRATANTAGVPGLNELPIIGNLFKNRDDVKHKSELIIFIKATIVNPDGSATPVDVKLYNKFITDPRPLFPKEIPAPEAKPDSGI